MTSAQGTGGCTRFELAASFDVVAPGNTGARSCAPAHSEMTRRLHQHGWSVHVALAALALVVTLALAPRTNAATACWHSVLQDWSADGRIDRAYAFTCYTRAVQHLPEDLKAYSSAATDIESAQQRRITSVARSQPAAPELKDGSRHPDYRIVASTLILLAALIASSLLLLRTRRRTGLAGPCEKRG